jgi:hypothetical protein
MTKYDVKIDLNACTELWGYKIIGYVNGAIDLEFRNLVSAAAFVNANDIAGRTSLTFPDLVTGFDHPVTVTVRGYDEIFKPID